MFSTVKSASEGSGKCKNTKNFILIYVEDIDTMADDRIVKMFKYISIITRRIEIDI